MALLQERTKDLGELEKAVRIQELALQRTKKISDAVAEAPTVSPSPSSAPAPDVRVVPPVPREQAQERITQGLHEFRSGRYLQAELAFLRAVPEAYGYIVLTCFVRGDVREAVVFLGRALAADPEWLRRVKPRDLFGDPADYEKALRALEERVAADPLDPEAKTLLAYFHYHEKGPEYAKALAVEATNARPEHAEARQLLQALGDKPSR
jgi:tetratricopeptide (TPR) repeat protein